MGTFCQFYGYTPTEYRALELRDFDELAAHMKSVAKATNRKR